MDFLQQVFFESPLWLAVFSFLLFAAALFGRRRLPPRLARDAIPVVLVVIVVLFIVQTEVVTERESILKELDAFVDAIAREDAAGMAKAIGEGYDSEGLDRAGIIEYLTSALESVDIYDTRYRRLDVTVKGNRADMFLAALATVRLWSRPGEYHTGRWRIGWAKEADGWRITSIRPEMLDTAPIDSLRRIRGPLGRE